MSVTFCELVNSDLTILSFISLVRFKKKTTSIVNHFLLLTIKILNPIFG